MKRTYRVSYSYTAYGSLDVPADSPEEAESAIRGLDNAEDRWQLELASGMEALETGEPFEVVLRSVKHVLEYERDPREVFAMRYLEGRGFTVLLPPGCAMGTAVREPERRAEAAGPMTPPDRAARALPLERPQSRPRRRA